MMVTFMYLNPIKMEHINGLMRIKTKLLKRKHLIIKPLKTRQQVKIYKCLLKNTKLQRVVQVGK